MRQNLIIALCRPYICRELPGWGHIYRRFVGGYESNDFWVGAMPRVIRDKRAGLLRLLDLQEWADRSFFFLGRWYDLGAQLILEHILSEGDAVVDAGANYGHFSLAAATKVGPTGTVTAFEPNPKAFARLQTHVFLNRLRMIQAVNAGLSDTPGTLELHVPAINSGEASFAGSKYDDAQTVSCPILTGDSVVGDRKLACIKIDVEGFELRVLKGLQQAIDRSRPWILTEIVHDHLSRAETSPEDIGEFLAAFGYTPMRLHLTGLRGEKKRIALSPFDISADEGDVLWVPQDRHDILDDLIARA